MLISSRQFCDLVGISHNRLEQRRLRERAAADVASSLGDNDLAAMPIAPSGYGQRAEYDAFDAVRLRAVIQLERCGIAFAAACQFIRGAGIGPDSMFPSAQDIFVAQWLLPGGQCRRICGDARDLARAMPEAPLAAIRLNLTAVREQVAERALAQLGLTLVGAHFSRSDR